MNTPPARNARRTLRKALGLNNLRYTALLAGGLLLAGACSQSPWQALREGFQNPPDSIRVAVYWYWLDNNISKEGVIKDLGEVMVVADVKVNGQPAGGVWTFPYSLDISHLIKEGENTLEVTVYNNWRNRLIADDTLPKEQRGTWTNIQPWTASDELQPSGLLGPVTITIQ